MSVNKEIVVLSSGGIDSTVCLAIAANSYPRESILSLSIVYGQRHDKELNSAKWIADYYGVDHMVKDLTEVFSLSDCALLKHSDVSGVHQSYEWQHQHLAEGDFLSTYVAFRNGLFLSCAASIAFSVGATHIMYGAHADDAVNAAYPDCSEAFFNAMRLAVLEGTGGRIRMGAPLINMNKTQVVKCGLERRVPFELTWSCYEGGQVPCGECGTCIDRARAFKENGIEDPALKPTTCC